MYEVRRIRSRSSGAPGHASGTVSGARIRPSGSVHKTEALHQASWERVRINPVQIAGMFGLPTLTPHPPEKGFLQNPEDFGNRAEKLGLGVDNTGLSDPGKSFLE